jgi:hypothetical protein
MWQKLLVCDVDKTLTASALGFDIFVFIAAGIFLFLYSKREKKYLAHLGTMMLGVLIFEIFTAPMWHNIHFGRFAYIYLDVSWILTLGWAVLLLSVVTLVDMYLPKLPVYWRFICYLAGMSILGFIAEISVVNLGLRTYSPEILNTVVGTYLWGVPIEAFYYIAVMSALVISFHKYLAYAINETALIPERRKNHLRSFIATIIGVFLFELMVEPMISNNNFPSWSYLYDDITLILTGMWIFLIWLGISIVDHFFLHWNLIKKFIAYFLIAGAFALPMEYFLILNGFQVYSESVMNNFTGFVTPFINLPVEIAFAVPLYMSLVIAFIKYWELMLVNKR